MPTTKFTSHLKRFFPEISNSQIDGDTVAEVVMALEDKYPGLSAYILDEHGKLRQHVNIFIGEEMIEDREKLSDVVKEEDQIFIFQALSGG